MKDIKEPFLVGGINPEVNRIHNAKEKKISLDVANFVFCWIDQTLETNNRHTISREGLHDLKAQLIEKMNAIE